MSVNNQPKRNYSAMSNQELAAFMRQFRRTNLELTCENGHSVCGCSNVQTMDGLAACAKEVNKEIVGRKNGECKKQEVSNAS